MSEKDTYHQAEVYRYFGCDKLKSAVKSSVETVLNRGSYPTVESQYFASAISKELSSYGDAISNPQKVLEAIKA